MKTNVGLADKIVRSIIGIVIIILFIFQILPMVWGYILLAVAVILIATSVIGTCPLYLLLRISTYKEKK